MKATPDPAAPELVDLDVFESGQVQEWWACEGTVGPEVLAWREGAHVGWWPCLSIERAAAKARSFAGVRR